MTERQSKVSRWMRPVLGALMAAVAIATSAGLAAPAASAGTIDIGACETASSVINPADLWSDDTDWYWEPYFANDLPATCAEAVDGVQMRVSGFADLPWDGTTGVSITNPFPATTLTGLNGAWMTNPAIPAGWAIRAIAFNDDNVQPIVVGCYGQAQCRVFSTAGRDVPIPADTRWIQWEAVCQSTPCVVRGVDWLWRTSRMTVTVNDPRAPVVVDSTARGSALTAPTSWLRGRQAISIRADDIGGLGVESTRVLVDGAAIASTNDATCDRQWRAGLWCYERVVTTSTINTAVLADGEHELTIEATDASGNQTQRRSTFRTDNHGDIPVGPSITPSGWTTTNVFDVRWTNPTGRGSPIIAAHVTRCDASGDDCETSRIAGADIATVTGRAVPEPGEWSTSLALEDEAGNIGGAVSAGSAQLASAPVATTLPTVTGSGRESEQLTTDDGTWTGVPTPTVVEHRWLICDDNGDDCEPFNGVTGNAVDLRPEHLGATFRAEIVARNAGGERSERSAPSAVVQARPPVLTAPPRTTAPSGRTLPPPPGAALREAVAVGGTLDVSGDAWDGTPNLNVEVQWQRCDEKGSDCEAIPGEQERTYVPAQVDVGNAVRAEIVARNVGGIATAFTDPVLVIDTTDPGDPPAEGEPEQPPSSQTPPGGHREEATAAARPSSPVAMASILGSTAPRARCVRELRVHLPAQGRLRVDGDLPGRARVLAGGRVMLELNTTADGVAVRSGNGKLLGTARSTSTVRWIRQSATRVTARAPDGSALVVLGIDPTRGRAIVKGRTCRFSASSTARVTARADRPARWSAWLVDERGTALANATILVTDGASTHTSTTNERGRARIELGAGTGSRKVTLAFAGDEQHKPAELIAHLTIQGVAELAGRGSDETIELHGKLHGAAHAVRVEYLDAYRSWRSLGTGRVATNGRWTLRTRTPQRHAGGPQLVVRAVVDAAGTFTARTGGEIRIDLRKAVGR